MKCARAKNNPSTSILCQSFILCVFVRTFCTRIYQTWSINPSSEEWFNPAAILKCVLCPFIQNWRRQQQQQPLQAHLQRRSTEQQCRKHTACVTKCARWMTKTHYKYLTNVSFAVAAAATAAALLIYFRWTHNAHTYIHAQRTIYCSLSIERMSDTILCAFKEGERDTQMRTIKNYFLFQN